MHRPVTVDIRLHFNICGEVPVTDEEIVRALSTLGHRCEDGRHAYLVEQVNDGVERLLLGAIRAAIGERLHALYGDEMVPTPGSTPEQGSSTARWFLELEESAKGISAYSMGGVKALELLRPRLDRGRGRGLRRLMCADSVYGQNPESCLTAPAICGIL